MIPCPFAIFAKGFHVHLSDLRTGLKYDQMWYNNDAVSFMSYGCHHNAHVTEHSTCNDIYDLRLFLLYRVIA